MHTGYVEWGTGVRDSQHIVVQADAQRPGHTGASSGVGRVLGEFRKQPVTVAAAYEIGFGRRILA
ncbi:hypothetical protein [Rhodococcus sp. ABRD24]|uniref:hypothetical protein n=1 Tax=Rhodococcus sp. ABRD24 TaxID=2507582 RepID=UPI001F6142B8|nr:hypothetical protein [Rhodococcus sp. ABRD24]